MKKRGFAEFSSNIIKKVTSFGTLFYPTAESVEELENKTTDLCHEYGDLIPDTQSDAINQEINTICESAKEL